MAPIAPRRPRAPAATTPSAAALIGLAVALMACGAAADDGWVYGRATKYGNDGGSTVHEGSCMFGYLDKDKGTGWDIAALSDADPDYAGSCGRCYEVQCVDSDVRDGYGSNMNRRGSCYDTGKSVKVTITDTCPCYYPSNQYSNKRWCCGDARHMDLSYTAFQKLANEGLGVISARWRRVACPDGAPTSPKCNHLQSCFKDKSDSSDTGAKKDDGNSGGGSSGSSSSSASASSGSSGGHWSWDDSNKKSVWVSASSSSSGGGSSASASASSSSGSSGRWGWDEPSKKSVWVEPSKSGGWFGNWGGWH